MNPNDLAVAIVFVFLGGIGVGMVVAINLRDRIWRGKGDHEYMNTMASGGHLYTVKREKP